MCMHAQVLDGTPVPVTGPRGRILLVLLGVLPSALCGVRRVFGDDTLVGDSVVVARHGGAAM